MILTMSFIQAICIFILISGAYIILQIWDTAQTLFVDRLMVRFNMPRWIATIIVASIQILILTLFVFMYHTS